MTISEGVATFQQTSQVEGTEKNLRFHYETSSISPGRELTSNLSASDANIIYYKVGDCGVGGAANPHLALTNPTKSSVLLPKGESVTVAYTSENTAAATIESNNACASVSGNVVTAESTGTATITVSQAEVAGTWNEASASFTVNAFDWDDVSFISSSDYKMKASHSNVNVNNIQSRSGHNCIYVTFPNAVGLACSLTDGTYEYEGAGLFLYTDAFTVRQTPFTVSWNGNVYDCYVFYNLDETPPAISNVEVTSYTHQQAVITIAANEAFVSAEVFNNGVSMGTFTPTAGAITLTGLTASTVYDQLTVKVKDAANNVSDAVAVPTFTSSDLPALTPVTYNDYGSNKGVYALYSITRDWDQSLVFSVKVDAAFGFNKRVHYYRGGVADVWADLVYNNTTETYDYTAPAGNFVEGDTWVVEFYFPFTGDAASIVCNYTVGSEQAAPTTIPVGAVVLSKTATTLSVGETDNITATVYPSFATSAGTVTWNSDATAYATVDAGTVTAVAAGSANITATCGTVTSVPCAVTVAQSLEETKFYGVGAFANNAGVVVSYDYVFTRATNHKVTLDIVFSRSMSGIVGENNFMIYINGVNQHMTYAEATHSASYAFGEQTEGDHISYYFYFPLDGGGLHQIQSRTYTVGAANDEVHAFAVGEKENNVAALATADGHAFDTVFVIRSFAADELYTLVLPFDADAATTAAVLPGQLTKLNNTIVKDNGDLKVNFVDVDAIEAGVPYLYVPSANVANPVFANVTISKDLNPTEPTDGKAKYYGIYAPTTGEALKTITNAYVLGSDRYLYAASGLNDEQQMKALRGYFVLNFPSAAPGAPKRIAQVVFNSNETETATGLENVQGAAAQYTKILENGTLYIVRDGKLYTAQGQLIK
ncbi:MAG: Ig domain-containing protein [Paludibacteraceae bacterium]|nr:Ig domain-containing protein [Paludibacteraceae bacterium]